MNQKLLALGGGGGEEEGKVGLNRDGRWIRTPGGGILSSLRKNLSLEKATVLLALTSCSFDLISSLFFFCRCDSDQCYLSQIHSCHGFCLRQCYVTSHVIQCVRSLLDSELPAVSKLFIFVRFVILDSLDELLTVKGNEKVTLFAFPGYLWWARNSETLRTRIFLTGQ